MRAREVYEGSDGEITRAYYARLEALGALGFVAMNLFRASKCSARAKKYSPKYKRLAYERKDWSLGLLVDALTQHAVELGIRWGWGHDPSTPGFEWVLYIDLPNCGQVSYHARGRKGGPDYGGEWDGQHLSAERIIQFCHAVTTGVTAETT